MQQNTDRGGVFLVGFEPVQAQALSAVAAKLNLTSLLIPGTLECIRNLEESQPYLAVIDIDGIAHYGPVFVTEARKAGVQAVFVCLGDNVPAGLQDQFFRAGADLVLPKSALFESEFRCITSGLMRSEIELSGVETFIRDKIACAKSSIGRSHADYASGANR